MSRFASRLGDFQKFREPIVLTVKYSDDSGQRGHGHGARAAGAADFVNLGKAFVPRPVDESGVRLDPIANLVPVKGGGEQADFDGPMSPVGI